MITKANKNENENIMKRSMAKLKLQKYDEGEYNYGCEENQNLHGTYGRANNGYKNYDQWHNGGDHQWAIEFHGPRDHRRDHNELDLC